MEDLQTTVTDLEALRKLAVINAKTASTMAEHVDKIVSEHNRARKRAILNAWEEQKVRGFGWCAECKSVKPINALNLAYIEGAYEQDGREYTNHKTYKYLKQLCVVCWEEWRCKQHDRIQHAHFGEFRIYSKIRPAKIEGGQIIVEGKEFSEFVGFSGWLGRPPEIENEPSLEILEKMYAEKLNLPPPIGFKSGCIVPLNYILGRWS